MCAQGSEGKATNKPELETEVIRLINAKRKEKGLREFDTPAALTTLARSYADDAACGKSTDTPSFRERLKPLGYAVSNWDMMSGTNGADQADREADALFGDSEGTLNRTILSTKWTAIGVGYAQKSGTNENSWVMIYACTATNKPELETEVIRLINAKRAEKGLKAFDTPAALTTLARSYATDRACGKSTDTPSFRERLKPLGYAVSNWDMMSGTNGADQADREADALFGDSEGTLARTILSTKWTAIGVGYAQKSGTNENSWVMIYAVPS